MLKLDLDATASSVFDGLLGLVEFVVLQAAMGRPQGSDASDPGGVTSVHVAHDEGQHHGSGWEWARGVRVRVQEVHRTKESMGVDTRKSWATAHLSLVICVSLRMAASAKAPLSPI